MKKLTYIIVLAVALIAGQALAVQVKQVALSYENGATVARVTADGPFQFRHQTEVPKQGKGDRMILDLIGVTTALSAKNYSNLPLCGITGIRTGQYSVTPEKVVRVVFDLTKPPVYQVQQQGNTINVVFTDKAVSAFTTWTTDAVTVPAQPTTVSKPTTTVAQAPVTATPKPAVSNDKIQSVEQDRLASLSSNAQPVTPSQAGPATTTDKPVVIEAKPLATPVPVKTPVVETAKPLTQPTTVPAPTTTVVAKPMQNEPTPAVAVKPVTVPTTVVATPVQTQEVKPVTPVTVEPKPTVVADANNKPTVQATPVTPLPKPVPVANSGNQIQQALSAKPINVSVADNKPTAAAKPDEKIEPKPIALTPSTPGQATLQMKVPIKTDTTPSTEVARVEPVAPVTVITAPVKPNESSAKPAATSIPKPLTDDGEGQLAEVGDAETSNANPDLPANKSTARFRRSAAADAKIKGTMVAEFPQRLVVKYESLGNRDPFATLIDDSRTYNSPVQNRVPNIDGLRLVGIIESDRGATDNRALFEDKNGYSYILSSGDKIQRGYVLRVESDRVYFQIFEYGWSRTVALAIENAN